MKQNEMMLNTAGIEDLIDVLGDDHIGTSLETPLRPDAFKMSNKNKIDKIAYHFEEIMNTLGPDLTDDSL